MQYWLGSALIFSFLTSVFGQTELEKKNEELASMKAKEQELVSEIEKLKLKLTKF